MGKPLRRMEDPVVAAPPQGARIHTRLHLTDAEAAALTEIGDFLGGLYRRELAHRISLGDLDHDAHNEWRAQRKQALTAQTSSRWAGSITRAVNDQYQLGMRGLRDYVTQLNAAIETLSARCALRPGELEPEDTTTGKNGKRSRKKKRRRGYATASERFSKTRRLAILRDELAAAEAQLAAGNPSLVMGGKKLWRNRRNLEAAGLDEQQWRELWDAARRFLTADGESSRVGGNDTIRVDHTGALQVKVPGALVAKYGSHLRISSSVSYPHRGDEWAKRVADRNAVRYDIVVDPRRGRWYLHASWKISMPAPPELAELRQGRVLGVDLNSGHLAVAVLDASGNPIGSPRTIAMETAGLPASRRDGHVRAGITEMLDLAEANDCTAIAIENLNFADARATGRETMGRGQRGKKFRRAVAGIPTAKFRDRLTAMASRRGIAVIGVAAAYTSQWGKEHWHKPLQQQTSDPTTVTGHHGAAVAIGRRGLGKPIKRRETGPRNPRRTVAGTPPSRPEKQSKPRGGRNRSNPPNAHPPGVPVQEKPPTTRGQNRSGRNRANSRLLNE